MRSGSFAGWTVDPAGVSLWLDLRAGADPVLPGNRRFADNLELSAQRALTVTRALAEEGLPPQAVFAAAFGPEQPVASNADEAGRARNRRVELAPVPRARREADAAATAATPVTSSATHGKP